MCNYSIPLVCIWCEHSENYVTKAARVISFSQNCITGKRKSDVRLSGHGISKSGVQEISTDQLPFNSIYATSGSPAKVERSAGILILSEMTVFRLFKTERICRRQFEI